jgi:hypothetical protein
MLGVPDYDPTLVLGEDVERVRSDVFIAPYPEVTPEVERFLVGQVLTAQALSRRDGVPFWFVWTALEMMVGPAIKAMLKDHYEEETWGAIKSRLMQVIDEDPEPPAGTDPALLARLSTFTTGLMPGLAQQLREMANRKNRSISP